MTHRNGKYNTSMLYINPTDDSVGFYLNFILDYLENCYYSEDPDIEKMCQYLHLALDEYEKFQEG